MRFELDSIAKQFEKCLEVCSRADWQQFNVVIIVPYMDIVCHKKYFSFTQQLNKFHVNILFLIYNSSSNKLAAGLAYDPLHLWNPYISGLEQNWFLPAWNFDTWRAE